jgi:hypothetical protein
MKADGSQTSGFKLLLSEKRDSALDKAALFHKQARLISGAQESLEGLGRIEKCVCPTRPHP